MIVRRAQLKIDRAQGMVAGQNVDLPVPASDFDVASDRFSSANRRAHHTS